MLRGAPKNRTGEHAGAAPGAPRGSRSRSLTRSLARRSRGPQREVRPPRPRPPRPRPRSRRQRGSCQPARQARRPWNVQTGGRRGTAKQNHKDTSLSQGDLRAPPATHGTRPKQGLGGDPRQGRLFETGVETSRDFPGDGRRGPSWRRDQPCKARTQERGGQAAGPQRASGARCPGRSRGW